MSFCFSILGIVASLISFQQASAHELRGEGGLVKLGHNRFAIPNPAGTRITFSEADNQFYYRLRAEFQISENSFLRILFAPLQQEYSSLRDTAISFNGTSFPANLPTVTTYKFNSYRLAYLYRFTLWSDWKAQVGVVAKIREAKIGLRNSAGLTNTYDNVGFVPLLNVGLFVPLSEAWEVRFDLDGAAAPQGRAFDGSLEIFRRLGESPSSGLSVGYRVLEGGADNDKVFTFSLFHYGFAALTWGF
jgi:hypothetical protein